MYYCRHLQNVYVAFMEKKIAILYISYTKNPNRTRWIITNNIILI